MSTCEHDGCSNELGPRQKRFCSRQCSILTVKPVIARKPDPKRQCPACGSALVRREGERASDFKKRASCGTACAVRLRTEGRIAPPKPVVAVVETPPTWRPEGWPAEIPADTLRHRGLAA